MQILELEELRKRLKRGPLFAISDGGDLPASIQGESIQKILPHRDPFLFLDSIDHIDVKERNIQASRWIDPKDPVFRGHFPGNPIYPGVMQGEIMFQCCLALLYFVEYQEEAHQFTHPPIKAVATELNHMSLVSAVKPDDRLTIKAHLVETDPLITTGLAQIWVGEKLCSMGIGDFYVT